MRRWLHRSIYTILLIGGSETLRLLTRKLSPKASKPNGGFNRSGSEKVARSLVYRSSNKNVRRSL